MPAKNDEPWEEQVFSSAEIEELTYKAARIIDGRDNTIEIRLEFTPEKAQEFLVAAERRGVYDQSRMMAFCFHVATMLYQRLRERGND